LKSAHYIKINFRVENLDGGAGFYCLSTKYILVSKHAVTEHLGCFSITTYVVHLYFVLVDGVAVIGA
jgi:hypothetical protein